MSDVLSHVCSMWALVVVLHCAQPIESESKSTQFSSWHFPIIIIVNIFRVVWPWQINWMWIIIESIKPIGICPLSSHVMHKTWMKRAHEYWKPRNAVTNLFSSFHSILIAGRKMWIAGKIYWTWKCCQRRFESRFPRSLSESIDSSIETKSTGNGGANEIHRL